MNREDFELLKNNIIYFDNSATTLKPRDVVRKVVDYYCRYSSNIHRGDYDIAIKADNEYDGTREIVREFINARDSKEIVFTSGTTDSINMITNGFFKYKLKKGDEVILTNSEHASNILPWFRLAKTNGIIIKMIPLDEDYQVTLRNLKKVVSEKTKVISLAYVTNVVGDIRPIKEITAFAHQNDIYMVVDGAQSVPHIAIDVQDLDCDFLAFSAHKMVGPTGVGVLYGKEDVLKEVEPSILGGGMNESFDTVDEVYLKELPYRLEAGTPNIAGVIALGESIKYLKKIGLDNIRKHDIELSKYLISKLKDIPHISLVNLNSESGIVSFNVDGVFAQDVAVYLNKYHVCVRAGNHCDKLLYKEIGVKNTVRISTYFYNTKEEIDRVVSLLEDKDKIVNEML